MSSEYYVGIGTISVLFEGIVGSNHSFQITGEIFLNLLIDVVRYRIMIGCFVLEVDREQGGEQPVQQQPGSRRAHSQDDLRRPDPDLHRPHQDQKQIDPNSSYRTQRTLPCDLVCILTVLVCLHIGYLVVSSSVPGLGGFFECPDPFVWCT
jgi:hypothetical protein